MKSFMSRGFTLVEVLAVIIILSIILALVMPNILGIVDNSKNDVYKAKEKGLENATSDYVLYKNIKLENVNDQIIVNINSLIEENFATKIYDLNNTSYECLGYVIVKKVNNYNYSYNSCIFCENYQTLEDYCNISQIQ